MEIAAVEVSSLKEVAPGLVMGLPVQATFNDVELEGSVYDVEMTLDLTREGVLPTSVKVRARDGGPPVSGSKLRALRVWDLAKAAIKAAVVPGRGSASDVQYEWTFAETELSAEQAERLREQGPTDETLKWVAFFYSLGGVLGLPPAKNVETNLGVPRTTASKWVRRAREKGLLDG